MTGAASADVSGNTNNSSQQGVQTADNTQNSVSMSGGATSTDASSATSGTVNVASSFFGTQTLSLTQHSQSDLGSGVLVFGNTNGSTATPMTQAAQNGLSNNQQNGGQSGVASSAGTSIALTGNVQSGLTNTQTQLQTLLQSAQSTFPTP